MSNQAQETAVAKELLDHIREQYPDDDDHKLLADMVEGESDVMRILSWIVFKIGADEVSVTANKEYQKSLAERAMRISTRVDKNRDRVAECLSTLGLKSLELDCATLSMRLGKPKVVIDNENLIHEMWFDLVPKLSKERLTKALTEGPVTGAHMSNASPSLTIRRK